MKINLGKAKNKPVKLPTQRVDVNTTMDFGFLEPMCGCFPVVPGSTVKVKHGSFIRFDAMPFPTFGRVEQKTYHYFVPIADIFHPYENLLAGQPYNGVTDSYVPTEVPAIRQDFLSAIPFEFSHLSIFSVGISDDNQIIVGEHVDNPSSAGIGAAMAALHNHFSSDAHIADFLDPIGENYHYDTDGSLVPGPQAADLTVQFVHGGQNFIACFRLTQKGQRIRKCLLGLGYQLNTMIDRVSILPIIAYLKVFYDYWKPKRDFTWKDTDVYKLMENIEQLHILNGNLEANIAQPTGFVPDVAAIIASVADCVYYQNPDYFTAQTGTMAMARTGVSLNLPGVSGSMGHDFAVGNLTEGAETLPFINESEIDTYLFNSNGASQFRALQILTRWVNKNTAIGGRIDEFLRVHFGAKYVQKDNSYFIGVDVNQISISDVMATAGTSENVLGEYAGKGIGYSDGKQHTFKADTFGYYINMSTVVPVTRFTQGVDPNLFHIERFDFYQPEFDGLTLLPSRKSTLFGNQYLGPNVPRQDAGFGYKQIYQEYKMRPLNISNGNFSRLCTQEYRGYMLDKLFSENHFQHQGGSTYDWKQYGNVIFAGLSPSTELRTIGKHGEFENYQRIFQNYDENELNLNALDHMDNIISHNVFEYDVTAPVIPYADAFDTEAGDRDMIVDKA